MRSWELEDQQSFKFTTIVHGPVDRDKLNSLHLRNR